MTRGSVNVCQIPVILGALGPLERHRNRVVKPFSSLRMTNRGPERGFESLRLRWFQSVGDAQGIAAQSAPQCPFFVSSTFAV